MDQDRANNMIQMQSIPIRPLESLQKRRDSVNRYTRGHATSYHSIDAPLKGYLDEVTAEYRRGDADPYQARQVQVESIFISETKAGEGSHKVLENSDLTPHGIPGIAITMLSPTPLSAAPPAFVPECSQHPSHDKSALIVPHCRPVVRR